MQVEHALLIPDCSRDRPFALAQRGLQAPQGMDVNCQVVQIPLRGQGILHTPPVAAVRAKFSRFDFNIELAHGGDDFNGALAGCLADDLFLGAAAFGDGNENIAENLGVAGQTLFRCAQFGKQFNLVGCARRKMIFAGCDAVFVEMAALDDHATLFAGLPASADGLNFDAELPRSFKDGGALCDLSAPPGGHQDQGVGHFLLSASLATIARQSMRRYWISSSAATASATSLALPGRSNSSPQ